MSIEDVLEWVERRRISGTLSVEWSSLVRKFAFDSGRLAASASNQPSEHVGQLLLRSGAIDEETLLRALDRQAELHIGLGRALRDLGAVQDDVLRRALAEQAREAICDAMAWTEGTFVIERKSARRLDIKVPIALELRPCIEEAQRRAERWRHIHQIIPSEEAVLEIVHRRRIFAPSDDDRTRAELVDIASAIDQGLSIGQIVLERYHRRFAALDRLVQLIERGAAAVPSQRGSAGQTPAVETKRPDNAPEQAAGFGRPDTWDEAKRLAARLSNRSDSRTTSPSPAGNSSTDDDADIASAAELLQTARRQAAENDSRVAIESLDRAGLALADEPDSPEAQSNYRQLERTLFAQLCRDLLTTFRVPKLLVERAELDQIDMSDSERYLAGRVDGRWDLLSLIRVSP